MNYFFSVILSFFCLSNLSAQATNADPAQALTERLTKLYQLDTYQQKEMYRIQQRFQEQLSSIAAFRETQPELFRQKRRTILSGRQLAVRRLLHEEQLLRYNEQQAIFRKRRAKHLAKLQAEKASVAEIEDRLFELETGSLKGN
ncbi:MAG: hypothetical protein AAFP19_00845 [Bacteroidota bacterium]